MDYEGMQKIERAQRDGFIPDLLLTVSEWSDRYRVFSSKVSAELGHRRINRTPYLKAIMDCLPSTSSVERVVFMKVTQLGAIEIGPDWTGYIIHHVSGPMMAVWSMVEVIKRNPRQRIDSLIGEPAALARLIAPARSRNSGNMIPAKEFRGGMLVMTDTNSVVGLRSIPVRHLFLDEMGRYPLDVESESDAISLAKTRMRAFAQRKIFIVSTPMILGASTIEHEYKANDQHHYFVPCPHCNHP